MVSQRQIADVHRLSGINWGEHHLVSDDDIVSSRPQLVDRSDVEPGSLPKRNPLLLMLSLLKYGRPLETSSRVSMQTMQRISHWRWVSM